MKCQTLELASLDPALISPEERSEGHQIGLIIAFSMLFVALICFGWKYDKQAQQNAYEQGVNAGVRIGVARSNQTIHDFMTDQYRRGAKAITYIRLNEDGSGISAHTVKYVLPSRRTRVFLRFNPELKTAFFYKQSEQNPLSFRDQ